MIAEQADADARGAVVAAAARRAVGPSQIELIGIAQPGQNFLSYAFSLPRGGIGLVEIFKDDNELVAAQTRHGIPLANAGFETQGDLLQKLVADRMTQGVIERLEVVEIDQHQCAVPVVSRTVGHGLPQTIKHQATIGQIGQRVVERQVFDFVGSHLAFGDVGERSDVVGDCSIFLLHGGNRKVLRIAFAVLAPVPDFSTPCSSRNDAFPHRRIECRGVAA